MSRLSRLARKWGVGLGFLALAGLGVLACGPSVQFIYEGHIRFEHCYRLDFDENIAPSHRKLCWEDWLLRYPKGQTRDRLEYAQRRVASLAAGERTTLTLTLADSKDAGVSSSFGESAKLPTNPRVPPPAKMVAPVSPAPGASVPQPTGTNP
jgi:hypothetical protein